MNDGDLMAFDNIMLNMRRNIVENYGELFAQRCGIPAVIDRFGHWNSADQLPPVDCPLVLHLSDRIEHATRTSYLSQRDGQMEYQLSTGEVIVGRFQWTYP